MRIAVRKCNICGKEFKPKSNDKAGKFCSQSCYWKNMATKKGKGTPGWKDIVSYAGIHKWINREHGKPRYCEFCGSVEEKKYQWANISNLYLRDINDWMRLCQKCHSKWDRLAQKNWMTQRGIKKQGITGIDFDGTMCYSEGEDFTNARPIIGARNVLEKIISEGNYCYVLTARKSSDWRFIAKWMFNHDFAGMPIHNVKLKGTTKIIDDRAIRFTNWQDIRKYFS